MKQQLYKLCLTIFILMFTTTLNAQIINVAITPPADTAGACRNNLYKATIPATGTHTIRIRASLNFNGGSGSCGTSPTAPHFFIVWNADSSTTTVTSIQLDTVAGIWQGAITSTDTVILAYHIYVDCSIVPSGAQTQNRDLIQTWSDPTATNDYLINGSGDSTYTSANLIYPFITKFQHPSSFSGSYLNVINETFMYINTGSSRANMRFKFTPDTTMYCGQMTHLALTYRRGINGTPISLSPGVYTPETMAVSDTLFITQLAQIDTCLQSCLVNSKFEWKCNLPIIDSTAFCSNCQNISPSSFQVFNAYTDTLRIERLQPFDAQWDYTCFNDTAAMHQWEYRFTNASPGAIDSVFINLEGADSALNFLTLIPHASLQFVSNCTSCTITTDTTNRSAWLCDTIVTDALAHARYTIKNFGLSDTIILRFQTFRCAEENDAALLNAGKFYNHWVMPVSAKTVCGTNAVLNGVANHQLFYGPNGISTNWQNGGFDIMQNLNFAPSVSDLSVAPGNTFGDHALMEVDLRSLVQTPNYDYQLLGFPNTRGYIRATVHCDQGLRMENPATNCRLRLVDTNTGLINTMNPVYYHTDVPDSVCVEGDYFYYFNLADSAALNYWTQGFFEFTLQACCSADSSKTPYEVKFHLMADPDSCFLLNFTDTSHTQPPTCTGLGCAWLPLSSEDGDIAVHCPGCKAPGVIVDDYSMRRVSFGLQDTNNDGRADFPLTQITDTSAWYQPREQSLRRSYSSFTDHLRDYLTAHFQAGDPSDSGYSYQQMLGLGSHLTHLQLERRISAGLDTMKITPTSFTLYIDTLNFTQPHCIDCQEFAADTMLWRTQQVLHVTATNLSLYLDTAHTGNLYLFTFESRDSSGTLVGNLHNTTFVTHTDTISPFRGFFEGQGYRLKVDYDVCGNFMTGNTDPYTINNVRKQSTISNRMFLSGTGHTTGTVGSIPQMPNDTIELHTHGWTLDPLDTLYTLVNDSFAASYLFYCETYGGLHYFFTQDGRNQSSISNGDGCSKVIQVIGSCRAAGGGVNPPVNIYPFEYRPNALWPETYTIEVPPGYHIVSARVQNQFGVSNVSRNSNWRSFTPPATTGTFTMPDSMLPPPVCLGQNVTIPVIATDTLLYAGSRGTSRILQFILMPDSCDQNLIYPDDSTALVSFNKGHYSCLPDSSCSLDSSFTRNMVVTGSAPPLGILPNLQVQLTLSPSQVISPQICIQVSINNPSITDTNNVNSTAAGFVYLSLADTLTIPYLTGWMFVTGTDTLFPIDGQIFQLDSSLAVNGLITGQLCANYISCQGQDTTWLDFITGWNCTGFPTSLFDVDSVCGSDISSVWFTDGLAQVTTQGKQHPLTYTLCEPFEISAQFTSNGEGVVYPQSIYLDTLPPGLTVNSVELFNYCDSINFPTLVTLNSIAPQLYAITSADLASIGFADTSISTGDCIAAFVTLEPECEYQGSTILPAVILQSQWFCGERDTTTANFNGFFSWDSTSVCNDCFTIEKTALQGSAFAGDTVTYQVVVCGYNATAQTLAFSDQLPLNFVATTTIPDSLTLPAIGCDTVYISGYYTQSGYCGMPEMQNTATIYFNGDSLYDSACTEIYAPCAATADTIVADSIFTSTMPATISNLTIFLAGRLYVNDPTTFVNCHILINTGGQIIVLPGGGLVLDSTVIEGCDNMWQGVYLESATLGLGMIRHSVIRDANWAVFANDKTSLKILNSSFENNVRGIYVPPATGSLNNVSQVITGNQFGMVSSFFKQPYPGQPVFGSIPYSGIEVNDIVWKIGETTADSNYFYNMNTGILGFRSALKVVNNRFNQIVSDDSLSTISDWDGSAIASVGKLNSVYGKLVVEPVSSGDWTIERSERGVYTDISDLDIQNVKMTGMNTGIFSTRCTAPMQSLVSNCLIEADQFGIDWRINNGSLAMTAKSNSIHMVGALSFGIFMRETSTTNTANYLVQGNYIQLQDGFAAVAGLNLYRSAVSDNIIGIKGTVTLLMAGIAYEGGLNNVLNCNLIDGDSNTDTSKVGVIVNISERTTVSCNRTDSTGFGFHFGGISPLTSFRGNTMINHFNGLRLNSVAVIDTQSHAGNRWAGTYTDTLGNWGAMNMNAASFTELAKSLFEVNPSPSPHLLPSTPTATSLPNWPDDAGWFDVLPNGDPFTCDSIFACHFDHEEERKGSEDLKLAIANDSALTMDYIPESKSIAKEYLFTELKNDTSLISGNVIYTNFVNSLQFNAIGYLYEVTKIISDGSVIDSTSNDYLIEQNNFIKSYTDSLYLLDSLDLMNPGSQSVARENVLSSIYTIISQIENVLDVHATGKVTSINNASQFNALVQTGEIPQLNEKAVNEIDKLYQLQGKEVLRSYESQLIAIASQCPFKGGKAVYRARGLLSILHSSYIYDDASVCASVGIHRNQKPHEISRPEVLLVPNPASDIVDVILHGYNIGICKLNVYNEINQSIGQHVFNCSIKKYQLDTSKLTPGVYTVQVLINQTVSVTTKLVVIR